MFHHMKNTRHCLAAVAISLTVACGGDGITDPNPPIITLSAQQAATITARAEAMATVHADLAWLADSVEVVVRTGAQAKRIVVTSAGSEIAYYAVGLQRNVRTSTTSFATWHLIAFDDASNPREFIIASGYAPGSGTTPPLSVNGGFGGESVFAHFIRVDEGGLADWRATSGGATFRTATVGGACPTTGTPPQGVTCVIADLEVSFDIVNTSAPPGESSRAAHLLTTSVPGVMLRIEQ